MAKKEGINTLQRLMNVVFIVWALWFLFIIFYKVPLSKWFELTLRDVEREPLAFFITFLGWLLVMAVNYIFNKKATVWNKDS